MELPRLGNGLQSNRVHVEHAISKVLASGRRRVGMIGLSFKTGTDDLRESPLVMIAEQFIGKGLNVLVYDPEILILDEATSNIDTEAEQLIQRAIDKVMFGRTAIIIAHRLSTIQKADRILVMSKGKICQQGTHHELLDEEGLYKKLYLLQFEGV